MVSGPSRQPTSGANVVPPGELDCGSRDDYVVATGDAAYRTAYHPIGQRVVRFPHFGLGTSGNHSGRVGTRKRQTPEQVVRKLAHADKTLGEGKDVADRSLVFGDGTPVPSDGSLAYRDSANSTTSTVVPIGIEVVDYSLPGTTAS